MKSTRIGLILFLLIIIFASCDEDFFSSINSASELKGTWECNESSSLFKSTQDIYYVYIDYHHSDSTKYIITNFYDLGTNVGAVAVIDGNKLILNRQTISGNFTLEGTGSVSNNQKTIYWSYSVDDGSDEIDEVSATYTLQY